jgi:8-oxo-dGTP diphosphatase
VETGESLDAAIRREVLEETGLRVKPLEMFDVFERVMKDARGRIEYHYLLVDYVCKVTGGKLAAADDVARAEWVPRERLGDYKLTEGTREVIERAYSGASRKLT